MIREKIKSEMELQHIKPSKLANMAKMTAPQMSRFINGKASVKLETLEAIFKALNIELIRWL